MSTRSAYEIFFADMAPVLSERRRSTLATALALHEYVCGRCGFAFAQEKAPEDGLCAPCRRKRDEEPCGYCEHPKRSHDESQVMVDMGIILQSACDTEIGDHGGCCSCCEFEPQNEALRAEIRDTDNRAALAKAGRP